MKTLIISVALLLFAAIPAAWSQKPFQKAPPGVEEALHARVSEYYTLFGQSKFRQAEALVTEESKDAFYTMNKSRHMGFTISGVTFADDVKSARVLVTLMMIMPMMEASPFPSPSPLTGGSLTENGTRTFHNTSQAISSKPHSALRRLSNVSTRRAPRSRRNPGRT